jgi:hypothetical protein
VLGASFEVDVLARVAASPVDEVLDHLDAACAAGLAGEDDDGGRFRFSHALVAETLAAELSGARRSRLHAAAVRAIEDLKVDDLERHLAELAHHAVAGAAAGTAAEAYRWSVAAARAAARRVAHEDAARHWAEAARAVASSRPGDSDLRYDTLLELGTARRRADDIVGADQALVEAAGVAAAAGDGLATARAAARFNHPTGWAPRDYGTSSPEVVDVLERALAVVPESELVLRADLLGALAGELYFVAPAERVIPLATEAVAVARRLGDPVTLAKALSNHYLSLYRPAKLDGRAAVADELVALADGGGIGDELCALAHLSAAGVRLQTADTAGADLAVGRAWAFAERSGSLALLAQVGWLRATCLLLGGHFDDAGRTAAEAADVYRRGRRFSHVAIELGYKATIGLERGGAAQLATMMEATDDRGAYREVFPRFLAWVYVEADRLDDARRTMAAVGDDLACPDDYLWLAATVATALVRTRLGDLVRAAPLYRALAPYAGRIALSGSTCPVFGAVDTALARLAVVLDDDAAARRHLDDAVAVNERAGARPWLARALVARGRWVLEHGSPTERPQAAADLARARALAQAIGSGRVLQLLDELVGSR